MLVIVIVLVFVIVTISSIIIIITSCLVNGLQRAAGLWGSGSSIETTVLDSECMPSIFAVLQPQKKCVD